MAVRSCALLLLWFEMETSNLEKDLAEVGLSSGRTVTHPHTNADPEADSRGGPPMPRGRGTTLHLPSSPPVNLHCQLLRGRRDPSAGEVARARINGALIRHGDASSLGGRCNPL